MRVSACLALSLLVITAAVPTVRAQERNVIEVRDIVRPLAFDPSTYFPNPHIRDRSIVRITYTGDDYGWPVHAIAVASGCVDQETERGGNCASRLRARMVRAPAPADLQRPRQRGLHLISRIIEGGAASRDEIVAAMDDVGLEWVEADLDQCPGARDSLRRSTEATWVPEAVAEPSPNGELSLIMHADIVRVDIQQYARLSSYQGWIAEDSPAAWAVAFADVLEPCWRPATAPAPWSVTTD